MEYGSFGMLVGEMFMRQKERERVSYSDTYYGNQVAHVVKRRMGMKAVARSLCTLM
jgi:hypothetical protein